MYQEHSEIMRKEDTSSYAWFITMFTILSSDMNFKKYKIMEVNGRVRDRFRKFNLLCSYMFNRTNENLISGHSYIPTVQFRSCVILFSLDAQLMPQMQTEGLIQIRKFRFESRRYIRGLIFSNLFRCEWMVPSRR